VVRWSHVHLGVGADERMEIVVDSLGLLLMEVVGPFWCS
jgi:hypothetical protein